MTDWNARLAAASALAKARGDLDDERTLAGELAGRIGPVLDTARTETVAELRDPAPEPGNDADAWLGLVGLAAFGGLRAAVLASTPAWAVLQASYAIDSFGLDLQAEAARELSARAAQWAKDRAAELVTQIDETTRAGLRAIIAQGLEEGLDAAALADRIEADASGLFDTARAETIARTELAFARGAGALLGYRIAGEMGIAVLKTWEVDGDPCLVCIENNEAGPIALDDPFPSGDLATPAHPNCQCHLGAVLAATE